MTVFEVKAGVTGQAGVFPTLRAAASAAKPGDTVIVHPGIYKETLRPPQGTTWQAAGPDVIIDGGWNGRTDVTTRPNQVTVNAPDVAIRGFTIRNVPGQGVAVAAGGDRFLMEDCTIHDCYSGGFGLNGMGTPVYDVVLRRVSISRVSRSWVVQKQPTNVSGCCLVRWGRNVLFDECSVVGGYGEGMAAGVETIGMTIRNCLVADTMHLAIYASNRAQNVLVEGCVIYHTSDPEYTQGDGDIGTGIIVGDETRPDTKDDRWQHAENVEVRGCLVVGNGGLFGIRNNLKKVAGAGPGPYDGYETRIQNLWVHHCTFVGGPDTKTGIGLNENMIGFKVRGRFENNVVILDRMREGAVLLNREAAGVAFGGNAWSGLAAAQVPTSDLAIEASALVNALADLPNREAFDIDNYRPVALSPLVVDGQTVIGALEPAADEPPPPPPPPPPPVEEPAEPPGQGAWREVLDEREQRLLGNCEEYADGEPGGFPGHTLILLVDKLAGILDSKEG